MAIALPLLASVVRNAGEEHRTSVAALGFTFRATEEPDQILMHRAMVGAEPIDQRLDIELCRFAAHRVPAVDIDGFAVGQGVGEGLFGHGDLR